jgi:tRNA-specific 2-thiouridylase
MTKPEVREAAAQAGLVTAAKPESQEICFVPDNDHRAFLRRRFAARGDAMPRGRMLTTRGEDLGEHDGIAFYTIGQRRGLGIAAGEALYVVAIDAEHGNVVLGRREECLFTGLSARGMNWMAIDGLREERRALVQVRHRHAAAPARLLPGERPDEARVVFDEPVAAVAPGQAVVFWDEQGFVLGGGWIERGERSSLDSPAGTASLEG